MFSLWSVSAGVSVETFCFLNIENLKSLHFEIIRFSFLSQVDLLLDEEKLRDEIRYLERNIQLMKDYNAFRQNTMMRMCEALQLEGNTFNNSKKLGLLLRWCGLIGALHGVKVNDDWRSLIKIFKANVQPSSKPNVPTYHSSFKY